MALVRVRLETAQIRLVFEGDEAVFERQIEPLLRRLANGRAEAGREGPVEPEAGALPEGAAEPAKAPRAPDAPTDRPSQIWEPTATRFRTFQRQLVGDPDGIDERIVTYAFYLWNYEKQETFGVDELGGCFAAEGTAVPDALADACAQLERQRFLLPAAHEGTWRLTPKGTSLVRKLLR